MSNPALFAIIGVAPLFIRLEFTAKRNGSGSTTLLGAGRLVPDVVGDGRGWHGEARFADKGCSYD